MRVAIATIAALTLLAAAPLAAKESSQTPPMAQMQQQLHAMDQTMGHMQGKAQSPAAHWKLMQQHMAQMQSAMQTMYGMMGSAGMGMMGGGQGMGMMAGGPAMMGEGGMMGSGQGTMVGGGMMGSGSPGASGASEPPSEGTPTPEDLEQQLQQLEQRQDVMQLMLKQMLDSQQQMLRMMKPKS